MAGADTPAKKSDLGVRTASAVVMLALAGTALWLGGILWAAFVILVTLGVIFEWSVLAIKFTEPGLARNVWRTCGVLYCAIGGLMLLVLRDGPVGIIVVLIVLGAVIATDIGAYFAGRAIGGPKIAPSISPSKTWAGLFGGMLGASLAVGGIPWLLSNPGLSNLLVDNGGEARDSYFVSVHAFGDLPSVVLAGALVAVTAQAGDFFESWMKRRAGMKDSGKLIPGHGGLFDRVDGLLAVLFVIALLMIGSLVPALLGQESLLPSPA
ncbi:MAG: phosphatidate cytidylyltransferase [Novosphingobium sp.]|nr:phosphatidate cytidylyltransferase [Novosphingobium sp.]